MISSCFVCLVVFVQIADPPRNTPDAAGARGIDTRVLETAEHVSGAGEVREVYTFYRDAEGNEVRHGRFTRLNKNGTKLAEYGFRDGKLDGEFREWHLNGMLAINFRYSNGKAVGASTEWSDWGLKLTEVDWDNGKRLRKRYYFIGDREVKDAKGKVSGETFYKNGIQASFVGWHANGRKQAEGQFDDEGLNDGVWTNWTRDGNVYAQGEW
jgi:antitoxin component YwqK of YwqJK toxin-antitoxin module